MKLTNIFVLLTFVLVLPADAEQDTIVVQDVATEILSQKGIPGLIGKYQELLAQVRKGTVGASIALKRLTDAIRKKRSLPLDTYNLHWRWHDSYDSCKNEYERMLSGLRADLSSGEPMNEERLTSAIRDRKCRPWGTMSEHVLNVVIELLRGYRKENDPEWDLFSLNTIIESIASSYPPDERLSSLYYTAKAEIFYALEDELGAIEIIIKGLSLYKDNPGLIDVAFRILADPALYNFKQIWPRKIVPIAAAAPRLPTCQWVTRLGSADSWDDALDQVDKVFDECRESSKVSDIRHVIRAFLYTGKFQWTVSQSYIDEVTQPEAFKMLFPLKEFRDSVTAEFLKPLWTSRGELNLEAMKKAVRQRIIQTSTALSPTTRVPPVATVSREIAKESGQAAHRKPEIQPPRAEPPRPEELIPKEYAIGSKSSQGDRSLGNKAAQEFERALTSNDLWAAKKAYDIASYNLYFSDTILLQERWNEYLIKRESDAPNALKPDPVIMGFGWRKEFEDALERHWNNEKNATRVIQENPSIGPAEIAGLLKIPEFEDPRSDQCDRMLDVAEVFARAKEFSRALQIARGECGGRPTVESEARILQALVEGLYDEYDERIHNGAIKDALEYTIANLERCRNEWSWAAAALSLHKALSSAKTVEGKQTIGPPKFSLNDVRAIGPQRVKHAIKGGINVDTLKQIIEKDSTTDVQELAQYIPAIRGVYQAQKRGRGVRPLYLYVESMRVLAIKLDDMGRAFKWWKLSFMTCPRRTDFDHLHVERQTMEEYSLATLRNGLKRDPEMFSTHLSQFPKKERTTSATRSVG